MTISIGQLDHAFNGRYRIEGVLGAGGMATVYTARDEKHGRSVAIKILHPTIATPVFAERFLREIRVAAQFSHPGILGLFDSGSVTVDGADLPYYVMPRIEGETLRARLERDKPLAIPDAIDIGRQIAEALGYAHARQVIHRDIKPENILLVGNQVLVADFGIAKAAWTATGGGLTADGAILGTPAYMSPEQVSESDVGPASDIFALGIVLYEMLVGELPFGGASLQTQLARRLHDTPTPVRALRPTIPVGVDRVVARMLARTPADRFPSGAEAAAALKESLTAGPPERARGRTAIRLAVGAAAVVAVALAARAMRGGPIGGGSTLPRSIAVLPFANVGADPANEYYGDGIADEVAGSLAKLPGFRIAARSSAFQFKGQNIGAQDIGRRIGVAAVVEGSVRPMGKQIRISAQLINAADGLSIWSESYERPVDQVFTVQSEISTAIARALGATPTATPQAPIPNSRAYEAFLQGRWHWGKRDREGFERAVQYFQAALKEDSLFAKAWAGLGDAYSLLGGFGYMAPALAFEQARAAASRAVALDSTLADAHTALGFIHLFYDRDWTATRRELEQALRLDPRYGEARLFYGWYLVAANRASEAVDTLTAAVRDEPVSLILNTRLGSILLLAGRIDEAKRQLRHSVELSESYPHAYVDLAKIAAIEGDYPAALGYLSRAPELVASYGSGTRGVVLARSGRKNEALAEAARLASGVGPTQSALAAAQTYAALGDRDQAFRLLEQAYRDHDWALFFARSDPFLAPLHGDSRWTAFVERMRFP